MCWIVGTKKRLRLYSLSADERNQTEHNKEKKKKKKEPERTKKKVQENLQRKWSRHWAKRKFTFKVRETYSKEPENFTERRKRTKRVVRRLRRTISRGRLSFLQRGGTRSKRRRTSGQNDKFNARGVKAGTESNPKGRSKKTIPFRMEKGNRSVKVSTIHYLKAGGAGHSKTHGALAKAGPQVLEKARWVGDEKNRVEKEVYGPYCMGFRERDAGGYL